MATQEEVPAHPSGGVIVGIDGSPGSIHALRWAVDKASTLGPVTPVTAYQMPVTFDLLTRPPTGTDFALYRTAAEARLEQAVTQVDPNLMDRAKVLEQHPGVALVEEAADAGLLVVGSRGRGPVSAAFLGSVSAYCTAHATVPVAVIPAECPASEPLSTIVVGVDGSENGKAALTWAVRNSQAETRVLAVGATSVWAYAEAGLDPPVDVLEKHLRAEVEASVAHATDGRPESAEGPETIEIVIDAREARVALRRISEEHGDLLVVGARGVSGIAHLLLGSVASALVHHPTVPTVVVPAR